MMIHEIMNEVDEELCRARTKFPANKHLLHALQEEAGEVTRAFLRSNEGKADGLDIKMELIQTITVAVRLLQEGDPDFKAWRPTWSER